MQTYYPKRYIFGHLFLSPYTAGQWRFIIPFHSTTFAVFEQEKEYYFLISNFKN